ncbi:hypothetical protein IMZ11_34450 [Microtetraspora sp. AC03309]|uniref:sensor histidine kinase n=1 Tax=Microtetraspora sp. AC03309 TaxID=2779376 RepID=UPI001E6118A8|nr:histidine kinase [Microtetraspora sp. AC03309]MCC5580731.1 hypothetical protein [Microtetraspora sp. AC03309]
MVTERTHPDGRPRSSLAAAASALSQLGRLRDLPVVLMLAWVGWLAIPWPFGGPGQARGTADQRLSTGDQRLSAQDRQPTEGLSPDAMPGTDLDIASDPGAAVAVGWSLPAAPAQPVLLVKPERRPAAPSGAQEASARESMAPESIAEERARIAGEVHDAAGHGFATIAMQAGVALLMLDERPDKVRESLEAIRATSTRALDQLRSALDLIDPVTEDHDLSRLVGGVRAAGLRVDLEPAEPKVPAHLQDTVYRVVRESLTNVMRHAGPTTALVRAGIGPAAFVVEIVDGGSGPGTIAEGASADARTSEARMAGGGVAEGRGLAGMRARVTDAGGTFSAGPREGGGFHVVARFPLNPGTV